MATKLSIALRTEEATRRLQSAIDKMAQATGAVLPVGAPTTKSSGENQAILLETLAAQIEALVPFAQPVAPVLVEAFDVPDAGPKRTKASAK